MHIKKTILKNNYGSLDDGDEDEVEIESVHSDDVLVTIKPKIPNEAQNWCDLFFILDILASNVDPCDVLVFFSKVDDHIPDSEEKKIELFS